MKEKKTISGFACSLSVVLIALLVFGAGIGRLNTSARQEGCRQLDQALRQSAAACYAAEGIYPPNVDYLRTHYGVQVDDTRYIVHYEYFADNLMPAITVLERTP